MARAAVCELLGITLTMMAILSPEARGADARKTACVDAHESGQQLRLSGRWRAAKEQLFACAQSACPAPIQRDCVQWVEEIRLLQPSLILLAKAPDGGDTVDVHVTMDGTSLADALQTMAIEVDPGAHVLRFEHPGWEPIEQRIVMHEGDRERRVELTFRAPRPQTPTVDAKPQDRASPPILGYALLGVAVAAVGVGATFGIVGKVDEKNLADTCSPRCNDTQVEPIRRDYVTEGIALGVGVVVGGIAAWMFVRHAKVPPATEKHVEWMGGRFLF
jgi:hypothetical protein